jgi:squalene cyclase
LTEQIDFENGGLAGDAAMTIWAIVALLAKGRNESDAAVRSCLGFLDSLQLSIDSVTEVGLATADVRCTAIACRALGAAGVSLADVPMQRSVDWLLSHESHRSTRELSPAEMSGWSAQGGRIHRVDCETTALTLLALREQFVETPPSVSTTEEDSMVAIVRASSASFARRQIALLDRMAAASRRSRRWLVEMQNPDGGWGRFERGPRRAHPRGSLWSKDLPNSDLSSPVVTSWVLEALARWDLRRGSTIQNAIVYLRRKQSADGCWSEHDGALSIYATWRAVTGLVVAGVSQQDSAIASAAAWLISQQLKSGGWCDAASSSLSSPPLLEPVSIVHTAWALLTLVEAGVGNSTVARRAVQFLLQHQQPNGGWGNDDLASSYPASMDRGIEPYAAVAWPLMAIAAWSRAASG